MAKNVKNILLKGCKGSLGGRQGVTLRRNRLHGDIVSKRIETNTQNVPGRLAYQQTFNKAIEHTRRQYHRRWYAHHDHPWNAAFGDYFKELDLISIRALHWDAETFEYVEVNGEHETGAFYLCMDFNRYGFKQLQVEMQQYHSNPLEFDHNLTPNYTNTPALSEHSDRTEDAESGEFETVYNNITNRNDVAWHLSPGGTYMPSVSHGRFALFKITVTMFDNSLFVYDPSLSNTRRQYRSITKDSLIYLTR